MGKGERDRGREMVREKKGSIRTSDRAEYPHVARPREVDKKQRTFGISNPVLGRGQWRRSPPSILLLVSSSLLHRSFFPTSSRPRPLPSSSSSPPSSSFSSSSSSSIRRLKWHGVAGFVKSQTFNGGNGLAAFVVRHFGLYAVPGIVDVLPFGERPPSPRRPPGCGLDSGHKSN